MCYVLDDPYGCLQIINVSFIKQTDRSENENLTVLLSKACLHIFLWSEIATRSTSQKLITALYSAWRVLWMGLTANNRVYAFLSDLKVSYRANETSG